MVQALSNDVIYFRQANYAESTKKNYRTYLTTYKKFCYMLSVPLVPATTSFLCLYAAYLAKFLLPQSLCLYISFVGLLHKEMGFPNPLNENWILSSVLKGIRRVLGVPPRPRLPITPDLLVQIRSRLNLNCSYHASFWAICVVAFFGLFRKVHLLPVSCNTFNPGRQFTKSDFSFSNSTVYIAVRWSKTIQLGQRIITVPLLAAPKSILCPVTAIQHAFSFTAGAPKTTQAFCWLGDSTTIPHVFTYKSFMTCMSRILSEIGIPPEQYGTHSFRRGSATFALEAGVSLDVISLLGDWKSDSMFLYLHMPLSQRISAQRAMASHLPPIS